MKILIFGGAGQLGYEIRKRSFELEFEVISPVISEVDITDQRQVDFLIKETRPNVIINAAAYTAVDKAETDPTLAYKINRDGVAYIAQAAKTYHSRFVHISTDYVFPGIERRPLSENDVTNPVNVYGQSKLAGEENAKEICPDGSLIVRTSSLHGQKGVNFVHTMLKLFEEKDTLRVVDDQIMSPTWAGWLAEVVLDLCRLEVTGTVHACGDGAISWFEFAKEIYELAKRDLKKQSELIIEPCNASEYPRPAKRPSYSVMDCSKLEKILGRRRISWKAGLIGHLCDIGFSVEKGGE